MEAWKRQHASLGIHSFITFNVLSMLHGWVPKLVENYLKPNQYLFKFYGGIPRVVVVRNEEDPLGTFIGGLELLPFYKFSL